MALWGLSGEAPSTLLDIWKRDSDVCNLPEMLEIANIWSGISLAQAQAWVVDDQAGSVQRQVAIAFILSQQNFSPTFTFWAQAGLFFLFNSLITRDCLGASLPMIVASISMSWEAYSKEPALLKTPKLSVPEILAAVASDTPPLEKLILLLEAGSFATGVRLPVEWRDTLSRLLN